MRPRDLEALGYEAVLGHLADFASSPGGKEACRALRPAGERQAAAAALEATWQCLRLIEREGPIPLGEFPDIRSSISRARHEGFVLDGKSLVEIRAVLQAAHGVRLFLQRHARDLARLADLPQRLVSPASLRATLERTLDADGAVTDDASDELADVRHTLRRLRERLTRRLEQMLSRPGMEGLLSDRYITVRNNRFVIPVKTAAAARIGGIVQDRSISGETTFIEPLFAVEMNNELLIAEREEERLVRRVLADLTAVVRAEADTVQGVYGALVEIDALHARARFAQSYNCTLPELGEDIDLRRARHPGLMIAGRPVVPIDLVLPRGKRLLVISGPNTGGKTVALKTLGLLALMSQSGMLVPVAEGSRLPCFDAVYADLGDEQSIERNLSTFSAHIVNLIDIMERLRPGFLVLLDEPGVGTDPEEGAALGIGVIRFLARSGGYVAATTHFTALKVFALTDESCVTAAVEIDLESMSPRYNLVYHSVGESMALPIARRLGLPGAVLQAAETAMGEDSRALSAAMERLEIARRRYEERMTALAERERASEEARRESAALLAELRARRQRHWAEELRQARAFVREVRERGRQMLAQIEAGRARKRDLDRLVRNELSTIGRQECGAPQEDAQPSGPPEPGDAIRVGNTGIRGELLSIQGDRAWIQRGSMRFEVPARDLRRERNASRRQNLETVTIHRDAPSEETASEIHLVGLRARDALAELDSFLDRAVHRGLASVRIVHGIGSGALRRAVADYLSASPYCVDFRPGEPGEGGSGVTVATLVEMA